MGICIGMEAGVFVLRMVFGLVFWDWLLRADLIKLPKRFKRLVAFFSLSSFLPVDGVKAICPVRIR
jgi:hypothetical protein